MQIGAQVVDSEPGCPWLFLRGFAVEEEDVRLHTLRIEDTSRQAQESVNVGLLEQGASYCLPLPRLCKFVALYVTCAPRRHSPGAAFEEDVIRQHDRGAAVLLEDGEDVPASAVDGLRGGELEEMSGQCQCGSHLLVLAQTACAIAPLRKVSIVSSDPFRPSWVISGDG